jgi:hypothetical protein
VNRFMVACLSPQRTRKKSTFRLCGTKLEGLPWGRKALSFVRLKHRTEKLVAGLNPAIPVFG